MAGDFFKLGQELALGPVLEPPPVDCDGRGALVPGVGELLGRILEERAVAILAQGAVEAFEHVVGHADFLCDVERDLLVLRGNALLPCEDRGRDVGEVLRVEGGVVLRSLFGDVIVGLAGHVRELLSEDRQGNDLKGDLALAGEVHKLVAVFLLEVVAVGARIVGVDADPRFVGVLRARSSCAFRKALPDGDDAVGRNVCARTHLRFHFLPLLRAVPNDENDGGDDEDDSEGAAQRHEQARALGAFRLRLLKKAGFLAGLLLPLLLRQMGRAQPRGVS